MAKNYLSKLPQFAVIFIAITTLALGSFCIGMLHLAVVETKVMNALAITNEERCCSTTMSQYIAVWKNNMLAIVKGMRDTTLLALGFLLIIISTHFLFNRHKRDRLRLLYKLYSRQNPAVYIFSQLKLVFAQGIPNPKVF